MEHTGSVVATKGTLRVIDCVQCGYAHLDPLPDMATVAEYYKTDYYGSDSWFKKELAEHTRGLWDTAYRFQSQLLRKYNTYNVIDWGCGAGFFPMWFNQQLGKQFNQLMCFGIEPNDYARAYFGLHYVRPDASMLPCEMLGNHRASLVFEHLVKPRVLLSQMKMSSFGGKVLIIVPHDGPTNPLQIKLGEDNWWVDKAHINYFSPQGLTNLLEGMGLRVTYRGATFPMELLALMTGKDYRNDGVWGAKCHMFRLRFEKALGPMAFRLYHLLHTRLNWGRELLYVGEG